MRASLPRPVHRLGRYRRWAAEHGAIEGPVSSGGELSGVLTLLHCPLQARYRRQYALPVRSPLLHVMLQGAKRSRHPGRVLPCAGQTPELDQSLDDADLAFDDVAFDLGKPRTLVLEIDHGHRTGSWAGTEVAALTGLSPITLA